MQPLLQFGFLSRFFATPADSGWLQNALAPGETWDAGSVQSFGAFTILR
jgi:hypothetical protein